MEKDYNVRIWPYEVCRFMQISNTNSHYQVLNVKNDKMLQTVHSDLNFEPAAENNMHLSFPTIFDVFLFQQHDQILSLLSYLLFVW